MVDSSTIRARDRDRERVSELLRIAVSEGCLTLEELDERLTRTYAARTRGELDAIVADLPQVADSPVPPVDGPDVLQLHTRGRTLKQIGEWIVPRRISISCTWGTVKVDCTRAVCEHDVVDIDVDLCGIGDVVITVPTHWRVASDEVATNEFGTVHNKPPFATTAAAKAGPATTVRLHGRVERYGDIRIRYRPRR